MTGSRSARIAVGAFVLALSANVARAQYVVELARIQTARSLAGIIVDPTGAPVGDTTVELCAVEWKDCTVKATAGPDGRFAIVPQQREKIYYLRFSRGGFDPLEFKVHVSRLALKRLRVKLHVGA